MLDDRLDHVLAEMTAIDPRPGREARFVIDALTGGEGLDVLDLAGVLRFARYGLPVKWAGPTERHMSVVEIAGDLFQRLGLHQYASVFRSPETVGILEAYGRSPEEGFQGGERTPVSAVTRERSGEVELSLRHGSGSGRPTGRGATSARRRSPA